MSSSFRSGLARFSDECERGPSCLEKMAVPGNRDATLATTRLIESVNASVKGQFDVKSLFEGLPAPLATLLTDAAYFVGPADFASLSAEQQRGLCAAVLQFAHEAPAAFATLSRPAVDCRSRVIAADNGARHETSLLKSSFLISRRRVATRNRIMSELRCGGNQESFSGDDFGGSYAPSAAPAFSLADILQAAIAGNADPKIVFGALPDALRTTIDMASQGASGVNFLELSTEAQRNLLATLLEAVSHAKKTASVSMSTAYQVTGSTSSTTIGSDGSPSTRSPGGPRKPSASVAGTNPTSNRKTVPARRPWWKFW